DQPDPGHDPEAGRDVFLRQNGLARADGEAPLRALRRPILILAGDADQITPLAGQQAMARAIPRSHLRIIARAGHMTPMEAPEAVTLALRHWLAMPA
ncbi:alpha/beta fold hydrolase, partial [Caulobacter sp. B11]|uniref:alpha/beta fold hydrolase n=1 Tax=Caulobacter sp. B11 TaxID=2048899 RepID=UPI001F2A0F71